MVRITQQPVETGGPSRGELGGRGEDDGVVGETMLELNLLAAMGGKINVAEEVQDLKASSICSQ